MLTADAKPEAAAAYLADTHWGESADVAAEAEPVNENMIVNQLHIERNNDNNAAELGADLSANNRYERIHDNGAEGGCPQCK